MTITVDEAFLSDIEAKAKAAEKVAPGPWGVDTEGQTCASFEHDEFALFDAKENRLAGTENCDASWGVIEEDGPDEYGYAPRWNEPARVVTEFIRVTDPPTTLALVAAHRAAIARIEEMEAKAAADLADYETSLETMERIYAAKLDHFDGMDGAACAAIRDVLKEFGATPAAFIDDAVRNGLVHARRRALEEAATIAENYDNRTAWSIAADLRALKDKEPGQTLVSKVSSDVWNRDCSADNCNAGERKEPGQ